MGASPLPHVSGMEGLGIFLAFLAGSLVRSFMSASLLQDRHALRILRADLLLRVVFHISPALGCHLAA